MHGDSSQGLTPRPSALTGTFLLVACSILGLTACSATSTGSGDEWSTRNSPIVNGQETNDYPATGMLRQNGQGSCTGTVVAPRTVVTAGHCVQEADASSLSFAWGPSENQLDAEVQVVAAVPHPNFDMQQLVNDIAVVTLAQDAPVQRASLNPSMDDTWIGRSITLVGYGVTDGPSQTGFGTKRMVDVTIDQLEPTNLHYTTTQGKSACNGDSGGPAYVEDNGNLVIVGVTSYGDNACKEFGVYTRVDAFLDFVYGEIQKAGPVDPNSPADPNDPQDPNTPSDPGCGKETWEGRCDGSSVVWCEDGQVQSIDCGACGFNKQAGYYDCLG